MRMRHSAVGRVTDAPERHGAWLHQGAEVPFVPASCRTPRLCLCSFPLCGNAISGWGRVRRVLPGVELRRNTQDEFACVHCVNTDARQAVSKQQALYFAFVHAYGASGLERRPPIPCRSSSAFDLPSSRLEVNDDCLFFFTCEQRWHCTPSRVFSPFPCIRARFLVYSDERRDARLGIPGFCRDGRE